MEAPEKKSEFAAWQLVWNGLMVRPVRTALAVLGVALEVIVILLIVGITTGVVAEWAQRVEGIGADLLVQPQNSSIFMGLTTPVMPESLAEKISALSDVDDVSPVLVAEETRSFDVVYGIDYSAFNGLSSGFLFREGTPFRDSYDAMIDDIKADSKHLHVGDKIFLLGHEFTVRGVVVHGKGARYYIPLKTAQDLVGAIGRVSMFYVRSTGDTEKARQELVKLLPGDRVLSMAEYLSLMNSTKMPELKPFIRSIVGLGVAVSFLVVLLTMYTVVMERTREIGILKSLGAGKWGIVRLVLEEALLMAGLGSAAGLLITYGIRAVLKQTTPTLTILIPGDWIARAVLLALVGALTGALYPAYRASSIDPVDALAYE